MRWRGRRFGVILTNRASSRFGVILTNRASSRLVSRAWWTWGTEALRGRYILVTEDVVVDDKEVVVKALSFPFSSVDGTFPFSDAGQAAFL
jgi:hypothetical protein